MMSEDSSMLFSQLAQLDTSMDTSGYEASLETVDQAKPKPKFAEFACSYVEVRGLSFMSTAMFSYLTAF